MEKRKAITNGGSGLMPVYTEPKGQDFWLRPGGTVEVRAYVASASADSEVYEGADGTTV